jgi:lysine/ornithine N-monooxygenase
MTSQLKQTVFGKDFIKYYYENKNVAQLKSQTKKQPLTRAITRAITKRRIYKERYKERLQRACDYKERLQRAIQRAITNSDYKERLQRPITKSTTSDFVGNFCCKCNCIWFSEPFLRFFHRLENKCT